LRALRARKTSISRFTPFPKRLPAEVAAQAGSGGKGRRSATAGSREGG
jgi:hypothetical protein